MTILWNVLNVPTGRFLKFQAVYWGTVGSPKEQFMCKLRQVPFFRLVSGSIPIFVYLGASEPYYFKSNLVGAKPKELPD